MIPQDIRSASQPRTRPVRTRRNPSATESYEIRRRQYVSERVSPRSQMKRIDGFKTNTRKAPPVVKLTPKKSSAEIKEHLSTNKIQTVVPKAKSLNTQTTTPVPEGKARKTKRKPKKENPKKNKIVKKREILIGVLVAIILLGTGYVSIDTWLANRQLANQTNVGATRQSDSPEDRESVEGADESDISSDTISKYVVAGNMPRVITIDKIKVKARVLQMGVNPSGNMQAPVNINDAGWYTGSSRPGEKGAVVIDAHASGVTRQGLFAYLNTLSIGDIVNIERGDGKILTYRVTEKETKEVDKVDMNKLMTVRGSAEEGLNLITCDGKWSREKGTFNKRTIIYSEIVH